MNPVSFKFQNHIYSKTKRPIPAFKNKSRQGQVITCWKGGFWDRLKILFTGRVWVLSETNQMPLQPFIIVTNRKDIVSLKSDRKWFGKLLFWKK